MKGTAVADKRLTPECNLSRGCRGVGSYISLGKRHLIVAPVVGIKSDRVCAVIVETTSAPVMIIGVHLPTTDSTTDIYMKTKYQILKP